MPKHITGETAQEYHDAGQEDASRGEYKPPVGPISSTFASDADMERQRAYDEGWVHTQDQKGK